MGRNMPKLVHGDDSKTNENLCVQSLESKYIQTVIPAWTAVGREMFIVSTMNTTCILIE